MKTSKIVTSILFGCAAFLMTENLKAVPQVDVVNSDSNLDGQNFSFYISDVSGTTICPRRAIKLGINSDSISCPGLEKVENGAQVTVKGGPMGTINCDLLPVKGGITIPYTKHKNILIEIDNPSDCKVELD